MILHGWLRLIRRGHFGIPFDEFQLVVGKISHAFTSIPASNRLMSPCNTILCAQTAQVYLHNNKDLRSAIRSM
jgi:hypothetical protein